MLGCGSVPWPACLPPVSCGNADGDSGPLAGLIGPPLPTLTAVFPASGDPAGGTVITNYTTDMTIKKNADWCLLAGPDIGDVNTLGAGDDQQRFQRRP